MTKEITLPPLPNYMDSVTPEQFAERVRAWGIAAVEADRAASQAVPSDLGFRIEVLESGSRILVHDDGSCSPATDGECALWDALMSSQAAASAKPAAETLSEALEAARAGLEWYRDRCPDDVDGSDDEADALIDRALSSLAAPVAAHPWQELAAALYQAAGAYDMPVRVLDALSAAANGEPFAHLIDGLLPVEPPATIQDREDAERMDWIIDNAGTRLAAPGLMYVSFLVPDSEDVRQAIDAARAAKGE